MITPDMVAVNPSASSSLSPIRMIPMRREPNSGICTATKRSTCRLPRRLPYAKLDPHSRRLYDACAIAEYDITEADVRDSRHGYYANISYLDSLIGKLFETLRTCDLARNTLIAITSDHGDFLGERGLWYKMSFFEHSARVPLIVFGKNHVRARRIREPATLCDLLPTFCDLAGQESTMLAGPVEGQ